jgi:hypothetical protein
MTRNHRIHSHFGANDFYKHYSSNGGTLSRKDFGTVLKSINLKIAEKILDGYFFKMPSRMGILSVTRRKEFIGFKDGKAVTNRPIDWRSTIELWEKDPESKEQKKLVRYLNKHTNGWIYKIAYNRHYANYTNKTVYSLKINRKINRELGENIFNGFQIEQAYR